MSTHPINEDFYADFSAAKRSVFDIAFESAYRVKSGMGRVKNYLMCHIIGYFPERGLGQLRGRRGCGKSELCTSDDSLGDDDNAFPGPSVSRM